MAMTKKDVSDRLKRIEGQVRGIQKMIDDERPCEDVITQLMAARSALDKVGISIITQHVKECARVPAGEGDESQTLERALALFLRLS
ncbi:MAG: metal-sensitive transcriptional regulator [Chloroflexi bacterium]|nr:metal-sensitive transcriptional regulator [Chloroflexota bacterium]